MTGKLKLTRYLALTILCSPLSQARSLDNRPFQLVDAERKYPLIKKQSSTDGGTYDIDWNMDYLTPMLRGKKARPSFISQLTSQGFESDFADNNAGDLFGEDYLDDLQEENSLSSDLVVKRSPTPSGGHTSQQQHRQQQQLARGHDLNLPWKLDILRPMLRGKKDQAVYKINTWQPYMVPMLRGKRSYRMTPYNMPQLIRKLQAEQKEASTTPTPIEDIGTKQ